MNTLPAKYANSDRRFVSAPQRRYVGAVDPSNPRLVATAQALYDYLNTNGCQQTSVPVVSDFQSAWLAAGGTLPQDTGGRSPIDGYYGANTAAALQQLFPDAVAGCVGPSPAVTPPTPLTVLPATNWLSISSISTTMSQHPWLTALFLSAVVAATYVNWGKTMRRHKRGRKRTRRPLRRRARARRMRRISRNRRGKRRRNPSTNHPVKSYAIQIKFGASRRGWTYYRPGGKNVWKSRRAAARVRDILSRKYGKSRTRIVTVS